MPEEPAQSHPWRAVAYTLLAVVGVLYLPLVISLLELVFFHTGHFEESMRSVGLHEPLRHIYAFSVEALEWLFRRFGSP